MLTRLSGWLPGWRMLVFVVVAAVSVSSCLYPLEPDPSSNKCSAGYCWIRSASTCCPNGYLNYAGAGYGCYSSHQACLNASGKCWYETSCIP